MIPGPDKIIACPKCEGLARQMTIRSGNTFGARIWTDGKQVAPMLSQPLHVVKCRNCGECFWLTDAAEIGYVDYMREDDQQINPAWSGTKNVKEPTEEEYYLALKKRLASNAEQEKQLRILAWWRSNDALRDVPPDHAHEISDSSPEWRKNLNALADLLTEVNITDHLMKVEVLRELGEFESAREVLSRVDSPDVAGVVSQFSSLCDARDTYLRELHFNEN